MPKSSTVEYSRVRRFIYYYGNFQQEEEEEEEETEGESSAVERLVISNETIWGLYFLQRIFTKQPFWPWHSCTLKYANGEDQLNSKFT